MAGPVHGKTIRQDVQIDSKDPGVKIFVRSKISEGQTNFDEDNR
jgi:hypothetical protein